MVYVPFVKTTSFYFRFANSHVICIGVFLGGVHWKGCALEGVRCA